MSRKLDRLSKEHKELLTQAKKIEQEIQSEQIKELKRESSPIRYDSENRIFTVRIPDPEDNSSYTEVELTLTEDQFDNLYQEITKEKIEDFIKDFAKIGDNFQNGFHNAIPTSGITLLSNGQKGFERVFNDLFGI